MANNEKHADLQRKSGGLRRWTILAAASFSFALVATLIVTDPIGAATAAESRQPVRLTSAQLSTADNGWLPIEAFVGLDVLAPADVRRLLNQTTAEWKSGYAPVLMEAARFSRRYRTPIADLLATKLTESGLRNRDALWRSIWRADYNPHPGYANFKSRLYEQIDPRFAEYFNNSRAATIRLDEVRWGGVVRDGIPPLKNPEMLAASDAGYLADTDVVFGIAINGDARAYPKRVLAWHEMFKDTVGGVSLCGVYCTLCGMVIPYETEFDGVHHELGTSGFLYRSNKLMYDHATKSMWSTTKGVPVIGPLVGQGIKLKTRPVVTTTWGEWRRRHPQTTVLSLNTGHDRDYGEGVAYRDYFASDRLMFTVPGPQTITATTPSTKEEEIANKAEVLALRFGGPDARPTAIRADFLVANRVHHGVYGGQSYVVITDPTGANRVYAAASHRFTRPVSNGPPYADGALIDETSASWSVKEDRLVGADGEELPRLSAHRAFWFGWRAAHPDTELIGGEG